MRNAATKISRAGQRAGPGPKEVQGGRAGLRFGGPLCQFSLITSYQKKHRRTARAPSRLCSAASSRRIPSAWAARCSLLRRPRHSPRLRTLDVRAARPPNIAAPRRTTPPHAAKAGVAATDSTFLPAPSTPPRPTQRPPRSNPTSGRALEGIISPRWAPDHNRRIGPTSACASVRAARRRRHHPTAKKEAPSDICTLARP